MLTSLTWLSKYVQIPNDSRVLVEDLTMAGLNVERSTDRGLDDDNIVVGRVLSVAPHPNADTTKAW